MAFPKMLIEKAESVPEKRENGEIQSREMSHASTGEQESLNILFPGKLHGFRKCTKE